MIVTPVTPALQNKSSRSFSALATPNRLPSSGLVGARLDEGLQRPLAVQENSSLLGATDRQLRPNRAHIVTHYDTFRAGMATHRRGLRRPDSMREPLI